MSWLVLNDLLSHNQHESTVVAALGLVKRLFYVNLLNLLKLVLSSTTVLIVVFLLLFDAALIKFRPLQYVSDLRFIPLDQHPMFSKIPLYMESTDKVDLLVLGSSLPMCAIAEQDERLFGVPHCKDLSQLRRYVGAKYLEQEMSIHLSRQIKAANLSIVACMASDMFIILQKSLQAGRKPHLAVLCISPRDFVDNCIQPIGRTPPFEILQDWKSLGDILRRDLPIAETRDLLVSGIWYYYRVKVDYRTLFTQFFSNLVSHPASLYYASQAPDAAVLTTSSSTVDKEAQAQSMTVDKRYRPPNFKRFELEIDYFRKILALCKSENIQCVVVNMPVSVAHRALLDQRLDQRYLRETQDACRVYSAHYLNFNDQELGDDDFVDGFHVNSAGAEKVMKRLAIQLYRVGPTVVLQRR